MGVLPARRQHVRLRPQGLLSGNGGRLECGACFLPHTIVKFVHKHNLVEPGHAGREQPFGIRVTLPSGDTLRSLLGDDWEQLHWYATADERDRAYDDMLKRHGYYRQTDNPTQILEKIER